MAQGPTNVNLIATYIHNNPGCRRVDIKRMLHKAATGKDATRRGQLDCKNQYFQRYGTHSNVYLDRLWYNELDKGTGGVTNRWGAIVAKNLTRTSSYQLTDDGKDKVWHRPMIRPFKDGDLVEWQWHSPNGKRRVWRPIMKGLVVECTDLYGLWVLPIGIANVHLDFGEAIYVSHQRWVRSINE